MIRRLVTLLGITALTYFTACGGGDSKPPTPPTIDGCSGQPIAGAQPTPSPSCGPISLDPQKLIDVQNAYNNARNVCCSTYGPVIQSVSAACSQPNNGYPPPPQVSGKACDDAITQAALIGKAVYAPWGGSEFPPYKEFQKSQGQAVLSCLGASAGIASPNDPRLACIVTNSVPLIQQDIAQSSGGLGLLYNSALHYAGSRGP